MKQTLLEKILNWYGPALTITVLTTALALSAMEVHAATDNASQRDLVYVGLNGNPIDALQFNPQTGQLTRIGQVAELAKPRWMVVHPNLPILYSVNDDPAKHGSIVSYHIDRNSAALTPLNEVTGVGSGSTYLWLDPASMTLLVANFGDGSVSSISINSDGSLGAVVSTIKDAGAGPHKRQAGPHAHAVVLDPSGHYALVSDLGADRVFVYGFNRSNRTLTADDPANPKSFVAVPGSGPRHLAFGADGRSVYLLNELSAEVVTLGWDSQQAKLSMRQTLALSSAGFAGAKSGSEIAIGRDGRFVYVSNRGENSLVAYRVNPDSGMLTEMQRVPSGGTVPWEISIDPSGTWMLVANQKSVNVFSIDPTSGMLTDSGQALESANPISITFVK